MATVTFDHATRLFDGASSPAVNELTMNIEDQECVVFVGPSGCGKSTSLRMVAGLEPVTHGRVLIGDRDMTGVRARQRDVAMVFQSYALYPNMTVAQNMAFALQNLKMDKSTIEARVGQAASMLELSHLLDRKPAALSGGQRQRVAMGRAIVRKPTVFCMDEPLSNLDAKLRVTMRGELASLQRNLGVTTIYVTHDQVEAMTMGHRVAVLKDGTLQQIDTPKTLYNKPINTFVAGFIGSPAITLCDCPIRADETADLAGYPVPVPREVRAKLHGAEVTIGIRPESWTLEGNGDMGVELNSELVEMLGSQSFVYARPLTPAKLRTGTVAAAAPAQAVKEKKSLFGRKKKKVASGGLAVTHQQPRIAVAAPKNTTIMQGDLFRAIPHVTELLYFDPDTGLNLEVDRA